MNQARKNALLFAKHFFYGLFVTNVAGCICSLLEKKDRCLQDYS